jgi:uncharacterized protein (TIGR00299 family) protein
MRIAFFDCFSGISGDMTVGALLGAGLPLEYLRAELSKLELHGYDVRARTIERSMIVATKFDVLIHNAESEHTHDHPHNGHSHSHEHSHSHDHSHSQAHNHTHDHAGSHTHDHGHVEHDIEVHVHSHGLSYMEIVELIDRSELAKGVKARSNAIFRVIAEAEAVIHGTDLEHVHFHEVGAIDSIVDIVSVAIGMEHFGIEECRSRVVPLGAGGFVRTAHGRMPIPTPATLSILSGYPTELGSISAELTTPTGAGIIKALSGGLLSANDRFQPEAIGYGAGTKDFPEQPNLLRIVIGELAENDLESSGIRDSSARTSPFPVQDTVTQLTASIDDMTPQELAFAQEELLERGALDVYVRPIFMKKGRLASELVVLLRGEDLDTVLEVLALQTTTIGVRVEEIGRRKAIRDIREIQHSVFGPVRVKTIGIGPHTRSEPEYEDVKRISRERGLPFREVLSKIREELA